MEKLEEMKQRIFTLKKRFREPDLKEIFETKCRSILEVYNKVYGKKPVVLKTNPNIKSSEQPGRNLFMSSNQIGNTISSQIVSEKFHSNERSHEIHDGNISVLQTMNTFNTTTSLSNQESSTSNKSSKSKKEKEDKNKNKAKQVSSRPIQRPPPNNLLNIDTWKANGATNTTTPMINSTSTNLTTTSNSLNILPGLSSQNTSSGIPVNINMNMSINNYNIVTMAPFTTQPINATLNTVKRELVEKNAALTNHLNVNMNTSIRNNTYTSTNMNTSVNSSMNNSNLNNLAALVNNKNINTTNKINEKVAGNYNFKENASKLTSTMDDYNNSNVLIKQEIQNDERNNYEETIPMANNNAINLDAFIDPKEELFDHTLPPEVMGGTPEFQKDEEIESDINNPIAIKKNSWNDNHTDENNKTNNKYNFSNTNIKEERDTTTFSSTKISIPNVYINENAPIPSNSNDTNTNISKKATSGTVISKSKSSPMNNSAIKQATPSDKNNITTATKPSLNTNSQNMPSTSNLTAVLSKKKTSKIIDDEDEEEYKPNLEGISKEIPNPCLKENTNQANISVTNSNKIKISFADVNIGEILSPKTNELNKSVKSFSSSEGDMEINKVNDNYSKIEEKIEKKNYTTITSSNVNINNKTNITNSGNVSNFNSTSNTNVVEVEKKKLNPNLKNMIEKGKKVKTAANMTIIKDSSRSVSSDKPKNSNVQSSIINTNNAPKISNLSQLLNSTSSKEASDSVRNRINLIKDKDKTNNTNANTNHPKVNTNTNCSLLNIPNPPNKPTAVKNVSKTSSKQGTPSQLNTPVNNFNNNIANNFTSPTIQNAQSVSNLPIKEILEDDIKKVEANTLFVNNMRDSIKSIQTKYADIYKKSAFDPEIAFEFETINKFLESINEIKEEISMKSIRQITERSTKMVIKLFALLSKEDSRDISNSEPFNNDILEILENILHIIKKKLSIRELTSSSIPKLIIYLRTSLKFITSVLNLKSYKTSKLKQIVNEGEGSTKDRKSSDICIPSNKQSASNTLKFTKYYKTYSSTSEKINKILSEIKREEDDRAKLKKQRKSSDFEETYLQTKKQVRTSVNYLPISKCYKILKNMTELIITYFKDTERERTE